MAQQDAARSATARSPSTASGGKAKARNVPGAAKIRGKELPVFTRQLSAMLSAGMPIVQSLMTLEEQTANRVFRGVIEGVRGQIEGGLMLSEALTLYPDIFDELYVSMFRAGEQGGMLAETASRIAGYLEASAKLKAKVKSAMMYPTVIMTVALLLATGMIIWIVPVFGGIFADFGAKLPAPTQFLMDLSDGIKRNAIFVIGVISVIAFFFRRWKKTPQGMYALDQFALGFPVVGELVRKVALARFTATFAQLLKSGVPILSAMDIVAFATGNKVLGKIIIDAKAVVEGGEPLSTALSKSKHYPRMLINMLQAGEKTGKVDEMLLKISEFYDDEVQTTLSGFTSLIEPLLMVFLGVVIGGIVVCMFLPIFKMGEVVNF